MAVGVPAGATSGPPHPPQMIATVASVGLVTVAIVSVAGVALLAYANRTIPDLLPAIAVLAVREVVSVLQSYLRTVPPPPPEGSLA